MTVMSLLSRRRGARNSIRVRNREFLVALRESRVAALVSVVRGPYDAVMPGSTSSPASRRAFLEALGAALVVGAVAPRRLVAGAKEERVLSFVNTHTRERITTPYFADGRYLPKETQALAAFLRDHRTGEEHAIDPALFDILHELRLATGTRSPFHVISGYRSPRTNAMLRVQGSGVASGSLHVQGRAIDIRLADVDSASLRDAALALGRGGVGYYRDSDFVHVDTGRVRRW